MMPLTQTWCDLLRTPSMRRSQNLSSTPFCEYSPSGGLGSFLIDRIQHLLRLREDLSNAPQLAQASMITLSPSMLSKTIVRVVTPSSAHQWCPPSRGHR